MSPSMLTMRARIGASGGPEEPARGPRPAGEIPPPGHPRTGCPGGYLDQRLAAGLFAGTSVGSGSVVVRALVGEPLAVRLAAALLAGTAAGAGTAVGVVTTVGVGSSALAGAVAARTL